MAKRINSKSRSTGGRAGTVTKKIGKKKKAGPAVKALAKRTPKQKPKAPPRKSVRLQKKVAKGVQLDGEHHGAALVLPKTHLTDKQLEDFKRLLLRKRSELVGDVQHLTDEALNRNGEGSRDQSSMPIHMADLGSDNWEQEFTLGLIENERGTLREIDEALDRIENKTYGICLATQKPISVARLRAKPWAMFCIDYARLRDEGRAP